VAVLVGPEGGWSGEEREGFAAHGIPRWSLGERVLRVETAAIAAAALVLASPIALTPPEGGSSIGAG
jgi:16S rRNA (uracil1498-N3)-methyltransferase